MKLTITTVEGSTYPLDVSPDLPVEDLKALLSMECEIPLTELVILHNMTPLNRNKDTLTQCEINDGDVIFVARQQGSVAPPTTRTQTGTSGMGMSGLPNIDWSSVQVTESGSSRSRQVQPQSVLPSSNRGGGGGEVPGDNPETLIQHFLANPEELAALQQRNPQLAEAIASGDINWIKEALLLHRQQLMELERERAQLEGLDPMSEEYQERLAENIRQRNIRENFEAAIEYNPEIIAGRVTMLYISCKVNGTPVKALVDTGAQMTVMSVKSAERCNIMRLVDRTQAGVAFGVGRQRIIGVVHMGQIQVGKNYLASSFRVLEGHSHDLVLGLDMMKRHQCIVDLSRGVLRIGTTGTETSFLSDNELQDLATSIYQQEERGAQEDQDREIAAMMERSEKEYSERTGQAPPPSPPPLPLFTEEDIQSIIAAGFTRSQAVEGLQANGGDVQKTLTILFANSLKF